MKPFFHFETPEQEESFKDKLVDEIARIAKPILRLRDSGTTEEKFDLSLKLQLSEVGAENQGWTEIANGYSVLIGLLLGNDVTDKITSLSEPLRTIIMQAIGWRD